MKGVLKNHSKKLLFLVVLLIAYYFCLPTTLFNSPTATVVESRQGTLLGARIADDEQWRFPIVDSVPQKFKTCLLQFEDAYFYEHPGFNPVSMAKAIGTNISAGKTVRGGSTITQQVIRLSRDGKKRSYLEKAIELVLATRLELRDSKEDILKLYASHAPFGGNVVGLDVAAWRYFGLRPNQLSWAESATLAVLPNAPSLIYPGKNQEKLLTKRNRLLKKLLKEELIDATTYELALLEKLPQKPYPLPKTAAHLVQYMTKKHRGKRVSSTVDENLQRNVNAIVYKHHQRLRQNQVHNAAVLVMDVKTRQVLSYVGNTQTSKEHQKDVDMLQANRSTGSTINEILKKERLVLIDFWAEWCGPCVMMEPAVKQFSENNEGVKVVKINADLNMETLKRFNIKGLPYFLLFRDEKEIKRYAGSMTSSGLHKFCSV